MKSIDEILKENSSKETAKILQKFFKTKKGEYGEGDNFIGIKVPILRNIAKEFKNLPISDIQGLLNSQIHEKRLVGVFIMIKQYEKSGEKRKKKIFDFYLNNIKGINNWDLVDLSAPNIIGDFLFDKDKNILYSLAKSGNLWEKRISIISTFAFIRKNEFKDTFEISKILINDRHDLIHKAVGWMLREVGKRGSQELLESFLKENKRYKKMPRTMLRYTIERFNEELRQKYLKGEI
jgi:3-methyladenine DNA glycosylase AlkD